MLSERLRRQWDAYLTARAAGPTAFAARDELHRFLAGVHRRGEDLTAAELGELLDAAGAGAADRDALARAVESGLALLTAYDRGADAEEPAHADGAGRSGM